MGKFREITREICKKYSKIVGVCKGHERQGDVSLVLSLPICYANLRVIEMARNPRKRSKTGIYHVMLKGIDGRDIFLDEEDKAKFLEKMIKAKEVGNFKLYGYCLMDNHVHLLVKESEDIGTSIKRITVSYVQWHNSKYGRTGHLFQNRYLSETVETDSYLICALRYINQNPVKGRLCNNIVDYKWNSYLQHIATYKGHQTHIDSTFIIEYFHLISDFEEFMKSDNNDKFIECEQSTKWTDVTLREFIEENYGSEFRDISIEARNTMIQEIYERTNVSIRQLARTLGMGKNIIERVVKEDKRNVPLS